MRIGDFARLGQVSVRMLRHYDAMGLLRPAAVDPWSGYRSYTPDQLAVLHRIVALKELGLTLEQVGMLLADRVDAAELRGMLRLRRTELAAELDAAQRRLAAVERRLHLIERENTMSDVEYVIKTLPPRRVAGRSVTIGEDQNIGEVVGPLFGAVAGQLAAGGACARTGVAVYESTEQGMSTLVAYDYAGEEVDGLQVVDLPAADQAVCAVHLGAMDGIGDAWMNMHSWLLGHGYRPSAAGREVYLEAGGDDQSTWVTELQQPVVRAVDSVQE